MQRAGKHKMSMRAAATAANKTTRDIVSKTIKPIQPHDELAQAAQGIRDAQVLAAAPKRRDTMRETVEAIRVRHEQRKEARR